jgi:hypothetical protein
MRNTTSLRILKKYLKPTVKKDFISYSKDLKNLLINLFRTSSFTSVRWKVSYWYKELEAGPEWNQEITIKF